MQTHAAFLKSSTGRERDAVEARLRALQPFASRDRYGLFLRAQPRFHRHVEPFYRMAMIADDTHASRRALIEADLRIVSDLPSAAGAGGLDAGFGARRLAEQGRAQAWRRSTAALDALAMTADEAAAAAARAA